MMEGLRMGLLPSGSLTWDVLLNSGHIHHNVWITNQLASFPGLITVLTDCKRSKTGLWEGLGIRLPLNTLLYSMCYTITHCIECTSWEDCMLVNSFPNQEKELSRKSLAWNGFLSYLFIIICSWDWEVSKHRGPEKLCKLERNKRTRSPSPHSRSILYSLWHFTLMGSVKLLLSC